MSLLDDHPTSPVRSGHFGSLKRYTHWSIPIHQIGVSTCIYRMFIFNCHGCTIGTPISKPCFQEPIGTPWVLLVVRCGWHLNQWAGNPIPCHWGRHVVGTSFFSVSSGSRHMWLCPKLYGPQFIIIFGPRQRNVPCPSMAGINSPVAWTKPCHLRLQIDTLWDCHSSATTLDQSCCSSWFHQPW